jgi:hypothetical protein
MNRDTIPIVALFAAASIGVLAAVSVEADSGQRKTLAQWSSSEEAVAYACGFLAGQQDMMTIYNIHHVLPDWCHEAHTNALTHGFKP